MPETGLLCHSLEATLSIAAINMTTETRKNISIFTHTTLCVFSTPRPDLCMPYQLLSVLYPLRLTDLQTNISPGLSACLLVCVTNGELVRLLAAHLASVVGSRLFCESSDACRVGPQLVEVHVYVKYVLSVANSPTSDRLNDVYRETLTADDASFTGHRVWLSRPRQKSLDVHRMQRRQGCSKVDQHFSPRL
ncbi:unnamed protein product [Protopolystoma xenopodis]|uniref:Uncharacterized protein n=1 Tax=Protopolystoma xenopodis TaxID=117903 RepID=A0A3S5CMZ8_9PLAT|nr:unnamed protein product [Protopolystoma xenopodis]